MAHSKLHLPDHLLSSKVEASGISDEGKTNLGSHDEPKDHLVLDSSIPLSPQWLYSKPSESKMDLRPGNSTDPSQKEGWRLDGSEDKKDWRRVATEKESSRRWREEERETGLLSARRDRRKADRRVDSVLVRETMENRTLASADRWNDGANRNSGHDARRDSKWSSRWGPDDKERESRTEKRADVEKDKDDTHNDNQSSVISNRSASERESDSRDKWRPRHRMEVHSSGSALYRAAPGFGLERGRVEGTYSGFTVGRGRSNATVRLASGSSQKSGSVIGKTTVGKFCYPRGKLLDIYRCQKLNPSFVSMPGEMEEVLPITQVDFLEPLAFLAPDADEEGILNDIWHGKITDSGADHNLSGKGKPTEDTSVGECESIEESADMHSDFAYGSNLSVLREPSTSFDVNPKLPDDSSLLFVDDLTEQNMGELFGTSSEKKLLDKFVSLEEVYLYYVDPHGQTQGPFLGGDIMLWFEEGYFGTDLPVRLADSPDGTPFQALGELMPHLQLKGVYPGSELEQSDASGGKLDPCLPASSAEIIDSSNVNDLNQSMSEINSDFRYFSAQHAQTIISEPQGSVQQHNSEIQNFHDFVAQDEEIVFPGRPGSSGFSARRSAGSALDPSPNSNTQPPFLNELRESSLPHQNDSKLHPFGMLWSELEGSHARYAETSDTPSSMGKIVPLAARTGPAAVVDTWSDAYKQDPPVPNSFQDAISARHLSSLEAEPKNFDLAEQLMAGQFHNHPHQQQHLQHRNMLLHGHLNESLLERMSSQNLNHQQLTNPASDLDHLLALELQQKRHLQIQQHQLQQQQQFHQQQKLLQERQQSQARQVLLDQLLHGQMTEHGLPQSGINTIRGKNALDQVLLEQQLIHDLHRRPHLPPHSFSSMEQQLAQAKLGPLAQKEQPRDLFELLSRAQHGQMSLERQILHQEQLRARQLSMGLRQLAKIEEERYMDSIGPINGNDQILRNTAGNHRAQSLGINPLDIYQQQQKPLHEDHLSHLERNFSFQDRLRQGLYEPGSVPFERSLSVPSGASEMNMDVVNALVHGQNSDIQELNARMQSTGHGGAFPTCVYPPNPSHPAGLNQFNISHMNGIEGVWPEGNGQLGNDWMDMESRFQQLNLNAERQKRDLEAKMPAQDPSLWMADELNDDKSRRLLMELLHQKSSHQPADPLHRNDGIPFVKRAQSSLFSGSSSLDHHSSVTLDQEPGLTNSLPVGSHSSNASEPLEIYLAREQKNNVGNNENLPFKDSAFGEGHSYLSGISEPAPVVFADSSLIDKPSEKEYFDAEGRIPGSKIQGMTKGSASEVQECITGKIMLATANRGDNSVNVLTRHSSLNASGFYGDNAVPRNSFTEDKTITQMPVTSQGQENILLRRPPVPRASTAQEGLTELVPDFRGKNFSSIGDGGNSVNQGGDAMASGKKDIRFRRTLSSGDADVSEPSFIDMLRSNGKYPAADIHTNAGGYSESSDGQGRCGKKKGKKGRQIDPALLGFKVTSNRIMMGEIQRIDD